MRMSGDELAAHLNRNDFLTECGGRYAGGRGTYKLIHETWRWLNDDLGLSEEAAKIAEAYVLPTGEYAYERTAVEETASL